MDPTTTATWGQSDDPTSAVAIFPADHAPGTGTITDWTYAQIDYYDAQGREVNTASYNNGWDVTTTEYDQYGNDVRELSADSRATALAAGSTSASVAAQLDTENLYSANGTELLDTYGPAHQAMAAGTVQTIRTHTHTHNVYDTGAPNSDVDAAGNPYELVTSTTVSASLGVTVPGSSDVDGRTTQYVYNNGSDNEGWTLGTPLQTITDPGTSHLNITKTTAYNENTSLYGGAALQIANSQPSDTAGTGAGTNTTVYYTVGTNPVDSACGNQPAWANLVCKTEPAAQPGTTGLASLPVTTYTYNVYLAPLTTTQTYTAADGTTSTRTTSITYDAADRIVGSTLTTTGSGMGTPVPASKLVYDPATGLQTDTESVDSTGAVTSDLYTTYDDFGQKSSYTDSTGYVTHYTYDLDGQVATRSDTGDTVTLTYNSAADHSGRLTSETDSLAGTFGATYDADGNLVTETYPGNTTGSYTYDSTDTATGLIYANSNWSGTLSDSVTENATADWTNQSVLDSSQSYTYDNADRLVGVVDTQNGECTTRGYTYDVDSNRTAASVAPPNADGSCQSATSTTESSAYDSADRLVNSGYAYDTSGDVTTTPSVDAGGSGDLTSTYYAAEMLAGQTQAGTTMTWQLDPLADRQVTATDSSTDATLTNHYADDTDNPTLMTSSSGSWTRNVAGPSGLAAQVTASGTVLQLLDLHSDVMATVDPVANAVTATFTYSETGGSETGTPGTYGWLGGQYRSSSALGGQMLMGERAYSTVTGRFSQTDPDAGASANAYDYCNAQPITCTDTTGMMPHWFVGVG